MKSLLIVTEQFTLGGLETHICGEIEHLAKAGVAVHLAVGKDFQDVLLPAGLTSMTFGLPLDPECSPEALLKAIDHLRQLIREHAIECVHVHPFSAIIPAVAAAELERVPYSITLHGPASLASYYGPIYDLLVKDIVLPSAPLIVVVSPEVQSLLTIHVSNQSVFCIPNAVAFEESRGTVLTGSSMDLRWLVVSRLDEFKVQGIVDFCIKAKACGIPGVVIAGDGPAKQMLLKMLEEQGTSEYVELAGVSNKVPALIQKFSGVAGMGRVVLEGISARKPVVLVGYDGVKGVVDKQLLEKAAERNFSGRNLPVIDSNEFFAQLRGKTGKDKVFEVFEFAKTHFNDHDAWSRFLSKMNSLAAPVPTVLTGLYHSLSAGAIDGTASYLRSKVILDRIESVVCSRNYYDPRISAAVSICDRRLERASLNYAVTERDGQIASLNHAVTERDGQIASLNQAVTKRDGQIASLNQAVTERDGQIASLNQAVTKRDGQIASLNQAVTKRDGQIAGLNQAVTERDGQIAGLNQAVTERDGQIASLNLAMAERDELLTAANLYKEDKEVYIAMLKNELETINSSIIQKTFRLVSRLKRLPHYVNRSVAVLRSRGFAGLLRAVAFKLEYRATAVNNNYVQPPPAAAFAQINAASNDYSGFSSSPLLSNTLVIVTGVPFDDVGGGQRAAQIARCALKTGRSVIYLYIYNKFDFELNQYVESDVALHGLIHKFIKTTSPDEVLSIVSPDATLLIELPHKEALPYVKLFNNRGMRTVFELIDDWDSSLGGDWFDSDVYRQFVSEARVVVGTARILVQKLRSLGRDDAVYMPNAANEYIFDKYKSYSRPADLPTGVNKVALYFGSLYGEWFAWDYLQEAAAINSDIAFILIGDKPNGERLPTLPPNVHLLGAKKIEELPSYLAHSDFGLLPFLPGKISDSVSPIKVFEYLFSGRPVVATKLPEILGCPGVLVANSPKEFSILCNEVTFTEESSKENDRFIFNNSWFSRLEALAAQSERTQFKNSVSVIVLVHNNKFIIGRCLESLLLHCAPYIKEVIVVDNASVDGGAGFIENNFPSVRVIRNTANGCSSGRNLGVQLASGRFLAFFDSDQWFTSSSCFEEALTILSRDANVGAIGWAGGWFEAGRDDLGGMIADYCPNRAMNDAAIHRGYRTDIGYLGTGGFFVPRSVFDATEGFDVAYDPTCFEDTDMSFQIKRLGLNVCYRDLTGIRHQPHQTTKASSGSDTYAELFKRNANYFKKKWSAYPHFFTDYIH